MKLNKILPFGAAIVAMAFASCGEDFLNGENQQYVDSETASEVLEADPEFVDSYTSGLWSWMVTFGTTSTSHDDFSLASVLHSTDMGGEDMTMFSNSWFIYDYELDNRLYNYRRTNVNWTTFYTMIAKANEILDLFVEMPKAGTARGAYGNAHAIRAYAFTYLLQLFTNPTAEDGSVAYDAPAVPFVASSNDGYTPEEKEALMGRNTVKDIFEIIEKDLDLALEALKGYKRPSKLYIDESVCQGIAARYYLLSQQWDKAAAAAKAAREGYTIMEGTGAVGTYAANTILDGFMDITNEEWMWGFDHTSETQTAYASLFSHLSNIAPGYSGIGYTGRGIDARLYSQMSDTDYRKMYWYNDEDGDTENTIDKNGSSYEEEPYAIWKFGWNGDWTMDYLWMRASEMVLIEAEAEARQGNEAGAATIMKELMAKRDPAWNNATASVEDIYLQRRLELIGEGFTFFDLKRLNKGIDRSYEGNNHLAGYAITVPARDPRWTFQLPRTELQENIHIDESEQNP